MSSAKQGQTRDMTQGSALSNILIFAIPLFISNFFQQCYNIGDTMIASHNLGQSALAAHRSYGLHHRSGHRFCQRHQQRLRHSSRQGLRVEK